MQLSSLMAADFAGATGGSEAVASGASQSDRASIMAEFEALRTLLDVMRPGLGGSIAGMLSSSGASMRPGSPGYEARELATAALRQLGPAPVRAAASALTELQVGVG